MASVRVVRIPGGGPNGELSKAEIELTAPDGSLHFVPMRLALVSKLRFGLVVTWPPDRQPRSRVRGRGRDQHGRIGEEAAIGAGMAFAAHLRLAPLRLCTLMCGFDSLFWGRLVESSCLSHGHPAVRA